MRKFVPYGKPGMDIRYDDSDDASPGPGTGLDSNTHVGDDDYNDGRRSGRTLFKPVRLQVTGTGKSYKPQVQSVKVSSFPLRLERGGA